MPSLPPIEQFIETTSSLKEQTGILYDAYLAFPKLLEREREAIKTSSFQIVEQITDQKVATTGLIEHSFQIMQKAVQSLADVTKYYETGLEAPVTLKDCVQFVSDVSNLYEPELFAVKILKHQAEKLREMVAKFDSLYKSVKPQIEANKYMVETLLENMRESYRFWLSIQEEAASGYDVAGKQKSTGRNSGFKAKV